MLNQFLRFLIMGLLNFGTTIIIAIALTYVLPKSWSYAIAWGVGLLFVGVLYPKFVFRVQHKAASFSVKAMAVYLITFAISILVIEVLDRSYQVSRYVLLWVSIGNAGANYVVLALLNQLNTSKGKGNESMEI